MLFFIYLFVILLTLIDFVSKEKKINIRWEYNRIYHPLKIPYTGIPFILLGRQEYQCHQGKDISYKRKENYKEKKTQNLLLTTHLQNTENWRRIQKKRMFSSLQYRETVYIPKSIRFQQTLDITDISQQNR